MIHKYSVIPNNIVIVGLYQTIYACKIGKNARLSRNVYRVAMTACQRVGTFS
jgi:hypothetical protein